MSKFGKIKSTNQYSVISQSEYDADPTLYIDRTDRPVYILNHYSDAGITYWQARRRIVLLVDAAVNGFDDFNDVDKDALSVFAYGDKDKTITFLMSKYGVDQATAGGMNINRAAINRSKMSVDAKAIFSSPDVLEIGIKYLTVITNGEFDSSQAFLFTESIANFRSGYENYAILGLDYGDDLDGLIDYIAATNGYASGGSKLYTYNPSIVALMPGSTEPEKIEQARLMFVNDLKNLFVEGNY